MCSQCEKCLKFGSTYERNTGGYWGKPISLCFNCLSEYDQEQIVRGRIL